MMGIVFIWYRKKSHVRLIPLQSESDYKVGRTRVQLSAIENDDAGTEGIFFSFNFISIASLTFCLVGEGEITVTVRFILFYNANGKM